MARSRFLSSTTRKVDTKVFKCSLSRSISSNSCFSCVYRKPPPSSTSRCFFLNSLTTEIISVDLSVCTSFVHLSTVSNITVTAAAGAESDEDVRFALIANPVDDDVSNSPSLLIFLEFEEEFILSLSIEATSNSSPYFSFDMTLSLITTFFLLAEFDDPPIGISVFSIGIIFLLIATPDRGAGPIIIESFSIWITCINAWSLITATSLMFLV